MMNNSHNHNNHSSTNNHSDNNNLNSNLVTTNSNSNSYETSSTSTSNNTNDNNNTTNNTINNNNNNHEEHRNSETSTPTNMMFDEEFILTPQQTFTRHRDSVLCCAIDPNGRLAVSGGIDDTAYVWNLIDKHVIFECIGHKESVVAVAFSLDGSYVATGDMNGYIQVRSSITGVRLFEYEVDEINWIIWHNTSDFVLLAGTIKGEFWMWNVNDPSNLKTFPSYGSPTTAAKILDDGVRIIVTYGDGCVRSFDLKSAETLFQLTDLDPSKPEITCMDVNPQNTLLAVGFINSAVKLININSKTVIGTLYCKSMQVTPGSAPGASTSASIPPHYHPQQYQAQQYQQQQQYPSQSQPEQYNPRQDQPLVTPPLMEGVPLGLPDRDYLMTDGEPLEIIDQFTNVPVISVNPGDLGDDSSDYEDSSDSKSDVYVNESVESILFSPCGNYLAAANCVGTITFWDVASQIIRCELHTHKGITRCRWTEGSKYVAGFLDGAVRVYDLNLNKLREEMLHTDQILDVAYKNNIVVTAAEDKTCKTINLTESS